MVVVVTRCWLLLVKLGFETIPLPKSSNGRTRVRVLIISFLELERKLFAVESVSFYGKQAHSVCVAS